MLEDVMYHLVGLFFIVGIFPHTTVALMPRISYLNREKAITLVYYCHKDDREILFIARVQTVRVCLLLDNVRKQEVLSAIFDS